MLSGMLPFDFGVEPNILELHEKIIRGEYEMPAEAVSPCDDLIKKMLCVNPEQRVTVEQVLCHPWTLSQFADGLKTLGAVKTYQVSNDDLDNQESLIPCDTTMLPYISSLYEKELEEDIVNCGLLSAQAKDDDAEVPSSVSRLGPTQVWQKSIIWPRLDQKTSVQE
ncbi:hypothetical protein HDU91_003822 [Kappamyces sp. JEL0680]|nr:hypothetical protein HDU91_003822 [Kappamyces sp. JEL0680]